MDVIYDSKNISRMIGAYEGDPFIAQKYGAIMSAQLDKGLDLFAQQRRGAMKLFRVTALLYAKEQYTSRIFHLAQAAQLICWSNETYLPYQAEETDAVLHMTCKKIEAIHDRQEIWKNPALCARALRQIERQYQDISLHDLSVRLQVNGAYLSRVLSQSLNVSFLDLLHSKRILTAVDLFSQPFSVPDLEVLSGQLGYASAHYFYCVFKKYVGLTPTECRRLMQG